MKQEILSELHEKMDHTVKALERDFRKIRTGRASTALLEGIKVNCYDTQMPLEQVASLSAPESRLITIQPWDHSIVGEIEKSILKSELGLNPMNDGKLIRISIPPLTEERRRELAKLAKKKARSEYEITDVTPMKCLSNSRTIRKFQRTSCLNPRTKSRK